MNLHTVDQHQIIKEKLILRSPPYLTAFDIMQNNHAASGATCKVKKLPVCLTLEIIKILCNLISNLTDRNMVTEAYVSCSVFSGRLDWCHGRISIILYQTLMVMH